MSDLAAIGGAVIALSACASGVCVAIAYHVPASLRDGAIHALERLDTMLDDETPADDDTP
jgi:hypothetical protein